VLIKIILRRNDRFSYCAVRVPRISLKAIVLDEVDGIGADFKIF